MGQGKGLAAALFISLAVNIFVVGAVVGGSLAGVRLVTPGQLEAARANAPARSSAGPMGQAFDPRAFVQALPPEERRAAGRALVRGGREARDDLKRAREARLAAYLAMSGPEYDRPAAEDALKTVLEAEMALRARGHGLVLDLLERLPDETRRQAVQRAVEPRGARRGDGPGGGFGQGRQGERGESDRQRAPRTEEPASGELPVDQATTPPDEAH